MAALGSSAGGMLALRLLKAGVKLVAAVSPAPLGQNEWEEARSATGGSAGGRGEVTGWYSKIDEHDTYVDQILSAFKRITKSVEYL